jgi:hypothetical protein
VLKVLGVVFALFTIMGLVFLPLGFAEQNAVRAGYDPAADFESVAGGATIWTVAHQADVRGSKSMRGAYCVDVYTYTFSKTADLSVTYTSAAIEMARRKPNTGSCDGAVNQVPSTFTAGQEGVPCWEPTAATSDSTKDHPLATFYNCGNLDVSPWGVGGVDLCCVALRLRYPRK